MGDARRVDLARYGRQMLLEGFGEEAQLRLAASHAVVVGVGALGCVSADLLVRAGVGRVTLVDRDLVGLTNLQRQTLYTEADARSDLPKAVAAAARLSEVNSEIAIEAVCADVRAANVERVMGFAGNARPGVDVIVDGTDGFGTRYLLNDVSVKHGVPYAYGGAISWKGMQGTFRPGVTACLRCVFPEAPAAGSEGTCDTVGVLGPVCSIVAAAQAADVIKLLGGREDLLSDSLLSFDLLENTRTRVSLRDARDPDCVCCVGREFTALDGSDESGDAALCGGNVVQVQGSGDIDLDAIAARASRSVEVERTGWAVRLRVEESALLTVFADGRTLVRGTEDISRARALVARYVGS